MRTMNVLGKQYMCSLWSGESLDFVDKEQFIALDTETEPIVEGTPVKTVIMQVCYPKARIVHIVPWQMMHLYLDEVFRYNPSLSIAMHTAGFDLWAVNSPDLWEAADNDKVIDVAIRWLHMKLSNGEHPPDQFNLARLSKEMLGITLEKNDDVRLMFSRETDPTQEQYEYAALDAIATAELVHAMPRAYPGENYQTKGYIALRTAADNGLFVDKEYLTKIVKDFTVRIEKASRIVHRFGVHPGEPGIEARMQELMHNCEQRYGVTFPRTEKEGMISVSGDMEQIFVDAGLGLPPFLRNYLDMQHYTKFIANYLQDGYIHGDGRVHPTWNPVLKTGRASCRKPNLTNLPKADNVRAIFAAPKGKVLAAIDYCQLELCLLAETCYQFYGKSVMRDVINSGVDIHRWFGNEIKNGASGFSEGIDYRQFAKAANFGFPGGLGITRFIGYAKNDWGLDVTPEQGKLLQDMWKKAFPESELHLRPMVDEENTRKNVITASKTIFPNQRPVTTIQDLKQRMVEAQYSDKDIFSITSKCQRYVARTITGRVRPNCGFCDACNYPFQTGAADGAKLSMYRVMRKGYKVVNFIHDELIIELPYDDNLTASVLDIADIMKKGMREICKDTVINVEYAVMKCWDKKAKWVYTADNKLTIWTPDIIKATDLEKELPKDEAVKQARANLQVPLFTPEGKLHGWQPLKTVLNF
jgi:DNA polymerase I-like protein with 3'-5' exonuclease and polymerase domains